MRALSGRQLSGRQFIVGLLCLIALNLGCWVWVQRSWQPRPLVTQLGTPRKIQARLPVREMSAATERVSVVFDEPVAPAAAPGELADAPPFRISPAVAGHWEWGAADRLDFVLDEPLHPGQVFRVEPLADAEVVLGKPVILVAGQEFQTPALAWRTCELLTCGRDTVTFRIEFDQPVDPQALLRDLKIVEEVPAGQSATAFNFEPSVLTPKPEKSLVVQMQRPRGNLVVVTLAKGLTGNGGQLGLTEDLTRKLLLLPTFAGLRAEADSPGTNQILEVTVLFSRDLKPDQPAPNVAVTPEVSDLKIAIRGGQNVVSLEGAFQPGRTYTITVPESLVATDGTTLGEPARLSVTIPEREPSVRFSRWGGILSPLGNLQLDLETVRVSRLRVRAHRIHANNLVRHLLGESYAEELGRTVHEQTYTLPPDHGQPKQHVVELRKLLQEPLGIYEIEARARDQSWTMDQTTVTVTDLGVIGKQDREGVWAWVGSIKSAAPRAGVKVSAWSRTNQKLVEGITTEDGTVRLPLSEKHPDGPAWVIVAEAENDLSYLPLDGTGWMFDDVSQGGRAAVRGYEALLYPERGIYRPGDTVYLTGLLRDEQGGVAPEFPLELRVFRPDGRVVQQSTLTPVKGQNGFFQWTFSTRDSAPPGEYRATVRIPGADESLGETDFLVESFVPVRLAVDLEPEHALTVGEAPAAVTLKGRYLFGQPGTDLPAQLVAQLVPVAFASQAHPEFQFTRDESAQKSVRELRDLKLNAEGHLRVEIPAPVAGGNFRWSVRLNGTVTEPGGRSVSKSSSFLWDRVGRHIGLRSEPGEIVPVNQDFSVQFVGRMADDTAAPASDLTFVLSRLEYDSVLRTSGRYTFWASQERPIEVQRGTIASSDWQESAGQFPVRCETSGRYRLVVTDSATGARTRLEFFASLNPSDSHSIPLEAPDQLLLTLDQPRFTPGSTARVVVQSPFAGRLVMCLESDRILSQQIIDMTGTTQTLEVPIPIDLRGGAFLSAIVLRPLQSEAEQWLPHRAVGLIRIPTDHAAAKLQVALQIPEQVRPGERITVRVSAGVPSAVDAPGAVHVWAVDEGILLTTGYTAPQPFDFFWGQRRRSVSSFDLFERLLPDQKRPASLSRIGGDGSDEEGSAASRRSVVPPAKIKSVVVWQGVIPLDAQGNAEFPVEIPDYTGQLRWMAVAADGPRMGATKQSTVVTSPLLVEAAWPRFLAPEDRSLISVKLFNSTTAPLTARLKLAIQGPLSAQLTPAELAVTVAPGTPSTIQLPVQGVELGTVRATLVVEAVSSMGEQLVANSQAEFPIRPGSPLETITQSFIAQAGQPHELPATQQFLPGTVRSRLILTPQPTADLQPALGQLLDYPYGCLEQTSSRIAGLLAAERILQLEPQSINRQSFTREMIQAGIQRLWSMQRGGGGLVYWPGSTSTDPWASAYAASILSAATQAGHTLPSSFQQDLMDYLEACLTGRNGTDCDLGTKATIVRVLASWNRPLVPWMQRLHDQASSLDLEARAELAWSWHLAGRQDLAVELLSGDILNTAVVESMQGRITSGTRQTAYLLQVLLEIQPEHPLIPQLTGQLELSRRNGCWQTTLENATALNALARARKTIAPAKFEGSVNVGGTFVGEFTHETGWDAVLPPLAGPVSLKTTGEGPIYGTLVTTGISQPTPENTAYDRQLKVRRVWKNRAGEAIDPQQLRVGDLIYVEVTLQSLLTGRESQIPNVAIVDALPAGLEVEHPRLQTSAVAGSEANADQADHVEFLDDRVVLMATAYSQPSTFRYALRVVAHGEFDCPAIQASCMYRETWASLHGRSRITISSP